MARNKMETFKQQVIAHMGEYHGQNNELDAKTGGEGYPHVLDLMQVLQYNFLPQYRAQLVQHINKNRIKMHSEAHHLNSSQVMCMNFFFPLMDKRLYYILNLINSNEQWGKPTGQFEKISDKDNQKRGATNFDFYIETDKGQKVYMEIKYTEDEFGKTKKDKAHREKWEVIYKPLLTGSPLVNEKNITEDYFFENYQLLRNISHAQDNSDYVIFLVPEETLYNKAVEVIKYVVKEEAWNHVRVIGWNEAFNAVKNDPQLADYYAEFYKKYLDFQ